MPVILRSLPEFKSFAEEKVRSLESTRNYALDIYDKLAIQNPIWVKQADIRVGYFGQVVNLLNNEIITMLALVDSLTSVQWHRDRKIQASAETMGILVTETEKFFRKNLFMSAWGLSENTIRRFRSAILKSPATGSIYKQCKTLYEVDVKSNRSAEFMELIKLLTYVRNTCHNDFYYYQDNGGDVDLLCKGKPHKFSVGKSIEFLDWNFINEKIKEMVEMIEHTIQEKEIAGIGIIPAL